MYNDLKAQKNLLSSIQRNIRIYYAVRGWGWFQFYTLVKGEMGKILAKIAEDARKKALAEGLAKIEGMLAGRIAEREAVEGINGELAAKKAGLAGTIEGMGAVAVADMEAIKAAEDLAAEAQKKLNALQQKAAKEKAELAAELKKTKAELTAEKEAAAAALSEKKAVFEGATGDFNAKKAGVIGMESANAAGKETSSSSWTTSPSWTKSEPPCSETRRKCLLPSEAPRRWSGLRVGWPLC